MRLSFVESLNYLIRRFASPLSKNGTPCYMDKLPNDILVDEVFSYLDVFDTLRMRQVSKLYYHITHHPAIWKRLLQRTDVPLPPVAPSSRNSLPNMNGYEVERIVLRAASLDHSWKHKVPQQTRCWTFQTFHEISSMVLLPGGEYLVASVADSIYRTCFIMVFAMDTMLSGSYPLAKMSTTTKAFHLQAKYMTVQGGRGIVISYVCRDYKHIEDRSLGINISEYSADYEIDPAVPLTYECATLHVSLSSLDILRDSRFVPGSEEFLAHAKAQPPPFRLLATIRSRSVLGAPTLDEIFGSPYLAVPKGSNIIVFKNLNGGSATMLHCNPTSAGPIQIHTIVTIRLVSAGNKVLVARKITRTEPYLVLEYFDVIPSGSVPAEVHRSHNEAYYLDNINPTSVKISDHGIPPLEDDSVIPSLYGHPKAYAPRPITVYVTARDEDEKLVHLTIFPKRREQELMPPATRPDVSFSASCTQFTHADAYATYSYPLSTTAMNCPRWKETGVDLRVLPGSSCAILYTVPDGDRRDAPRILDYYCYFDPERSTAEAELQVSTSNDTLEGKRRSTRWIETPEKVEAFESVKALAWDETIGRLCICGGYTGTVTEVHVLDFAKAPLPMIVGDKIERYPVPVRLQPDPDAIAAPLPPLPRNSSGDDNLMDVDGFA